MRSIRPPYLLPLGAAADLSLTSVVYNSYLKPCASLHMITNIYIKKRYLQQVADEKTMNRLGSYIIIVLYILLSLSYDSFLNISRNMLKLFSGYFGTKFSLFNRLIQARVSGTS